MLIPDSWRTYGGDARAVLRDFDFAKKNVEDFTTDLLDKIRVGDNVFRYLYSRKPGQLLEGFDNTYKVVPLGYEGRGGKELYHTPNGPIRLPQGYEYIGSFDGTKHRYNQSGPSSDSPFWNGKRMGSYAIIQESEEKPNPKINFKPIDFGKVASNDIFNYKPSPEKVLNPKYIEKSLPFDRYLSQRSQQMEDDRQAAMG